MQPVTRGAEDFRDSMVSDRDRAIADWYREGGQYFIDWVKKYYRTHRGEKVKWEEPFTEEVYLLFGHPWTESILIEKAAQQGYTEILVAYTAFALAGIRISIGVGFEQQNKQFILVGERFQKAFDYCEEIQRLNKERRDRTRREDTDNKSVMSVGGVECYFFFARFPQSNDNADQTPAVLRSNPMQSVLGDEYGLWSPGVADVAKARMEATFLPSKPIRRGSTPSYEGSFFDEEVKAAKHLFQWHCTCPSCGQDQFLDPYGNLLKPVAIENDAGFQEIRYFSRMGRPLEWFSHDPDNPEETAYVGCSHCGEELPWEAIAAGYFRDRKTMIPLREYCKGRTLVKEDVALRMPKLASRLGKASDLIFTLNHTKKPSDAIQQMLGKPISIGSGKIEVNSLLDARSIRPPAREPDLIVAGIDQGRYSHWLVVTAWWLPDAPTPKERWEKAHTSVLHWGEVETLAIAEEVEEYQIDVIGADQNPEFSVASDFAAENVPRGYFTQSKERLLGQTYLFNQSALKGKLSRREELNLRELGVTGKRKRRRGRSQEIIIRYTIDRTYGLDDIRDRIYGRQLSLPPDMEYHPKQHDNLIAHLANSERTQDGMWVEGGQPDHGFHALCFASQATFAHLVEPGISRRGAIVREVRQKKTPKGGIPGW